MNELVVGGRIMNFEGRFPCVRAFQEPRRALIFENRDASTTHQLIVILEWRADLAGGHRSATRRTLYFFPLTPVLYVTVFPSTLIHFSSTHKDFLYLRIQLSPACVNVRVTRISRQTRYQPHEITAQRL